MCFSEKQFRGRFRQKRAKFSFRNAPYSPFGPKNRWGCGFVKKIQTGNAFFGKRFWGRFRQNWAEFSPIVGRLGKPILSCRLHLLYCLHMGVLTWFDLICCLTAGRDTMKFISFHNFHVARSLSFLLWSIMEILTLELKVYHTFVFL